MRTEIQEPFRSNIGHANAMAPIDTTAHSPGPTKVQEPDSASDGCPMYFVKSWAAARALGWSHYP